MGDTVQFTTYAAQVNPAIGTLAITKQGEAWTPILNGQIVGASKFEVNGDGTNSTNPISFEWCERPTASPPDPAFVGHVLYSGESEIVGDLGLNQSIFARALDGRGGIMVVTPGG